MVDLGTAAGATDLPNPISPLECPVPPQLDSAASRTMTGQELQQILLRKWGRSFDIQLRRTQGKIFVLVMWKYLEQASFPLSEADYIAHLDTVASYLHAWGSAEFVQAFIEQTRERPRLGKAVSIPIELGDRASEWILDDL